MKKLLSVVLSVIMVCTIGITSIEAKPTKPNENTTTEATKATNATVASQNATTNATTSQQATTSSQQVTSSQQATSSQQTTSSQQATSSESTTQSTSEAVKEPSGTMSVDADYGYIGENVRVTVTINGKNLAGYTAILTYDASKLEYVECAGAKSTDGINFVSDGTSDTLETFVVIFKVNAEAKEGDTYKVNCNVSLNNSTYGTLSNVDSVVIVKKEEMTSTEEATTKKPNTHNTPLSTDASLMNISVAGYSLSPKFDSEVTNYELTIPKGVTSISVTAIVSDSKASYRVIGADNLGEGENTVKVICTSESGETETYTIKVLREAEKENTTTTTKQTEKQTTTVATTNNAKAKSSGVAWWIVFLLCIAFMGAGFGLCYLIFVGFDEVGNSVRDKKESSTSKKYQNEYDDIEFLDDIEDIDEIEDIDDDFE